VMLFSWGGFDIIAEQQILIAQVKLSVGNYGVRPGLFLGTIGLFETAFFSVAVRGRVDEDDRAGLFFAAIEFSVRVDH
jgi:hypothetical protein